MQVMPEGKPQKIPLFPLASGRTEVDERHGISFQKLAQHVPFRHVPHRHDFYHLIWIESGQGTFMRDGRSYPADAGTLIFVPPGQVHTWKWEQPLQGYVLSFEPVLLFGQPVRPSVSEGGSDGLSRLLHELSRWSTESEVRSQAGGSIRDFMRERFEDLAREFGSREEFHNEMLRAQITSLLIFLHRLYVGGAPVEPHEHFASLTGRFLSRLEEADGKFYRTSYFTSALSVSSRALTNAVLVDTGKSPSVWIRDRTLLEARRLLTYTDLTISEIAYRLNFRNVSYFVRFYRRLTGQSPGAARSELRRRSEGIRPPE
jgi:AraC family transcriptional regulator, transcriptional activator of pobA